MILLSGEVLVFLGTEAVLLVLLLVAAVQTARILPVWDFSASSRAQYARESRAALVGLLVGAVLLFKLLLLPFFTHTVDRLSALVPGAMCGAGVLGANNWGTPLLLLKVVVVMALGLWWLVRRLDLDAPDHPHLRRLLSLFWPLLILVLLEGLLDVLFLTNISTLSPVQCCSRIFGLAGETGGPPLGLGVGSILLLFYLVFLLAVLAGVLGYGLLQMLAGLLFLPVGYLALVYFFGTYVYQLPTHLCPVCMLQPTYGYIGYGLWGALLAGTFAAVAGHPLEIITGDRSRRLGLWGVGLQTLFVLSCSLLVGLYFLRHGVLL